MVNNNDMLRAKQLLRNDERAQGIGDTSACITNDMGITLFKAKGASGINARDIKMKGVCAIGAHGKRLDFFETGQRGIVVRRNFLSPLNPAFEFSELA